jgi:hypothetical protein
LNLAAVFSILVYDVFFESGECSSISQLRICQRVVGPLFGHAFVETRSLVWKRDASSSRLLVFFAALETSTMC